MNFFRQLAQTLVGIQLEIKQIKEIVMAIFEELKALTESQATTIAELKTIALSQKADLDYAVGILAGAADGMSGTDAAALKTLLVNNSNELNDARNKVQVNEGRITPPVVEPPPPVA